MEMPTLPYRLIHNLLGLVLHTSQKKLNSAFWLTSDSVAEDVVLATATLEVGGAVVVSTDTGGVDVATAGGAATGVVEMLVLVELVLVDVEVEDELLKLELLLVLVLVLVLVPLDSCALTATASFEMAEWHCAIKLSENAP